MKAVQNRYDVIILGAGPAGSAASAILAQKGRSVLTLEREKFPRYHIGESLIPYTYFPLERMGMIDKMKASSFTKKYSVQFVTPDGKQSVPFYFFKHLKHEASCTWQVVRGDFDKMLMENAREKGAEVHEETRVTELLQDGDSVVGVKAVGKDGGEFEVRAPMTIDATGRDAFSMMRNKWRVRDPQLNKIAVWTYYKGAKRDPGVDEGATTVAYVPEKGWFWYIPLPDDIISVGVVAEKDYLYKDSRDLEEIFQREVKNNAWIDEHLAQGAQIGEYRVTGEYSYRSKYCAADGLVLIGDAFAFLDPVFSSGVFLALRSGELAADAVDAALNAQDYSAARFTEYGDEMRKGIEAMRRLVYTFYDHNFSFGAFLKQHPNFRGEITDCLIGNSHLDYDPMFEAISEFAAVPPPLAHGRPLPAHAS
jgi:flavin-dependent dehydrogenase